MGPLECRCELPNAQHDVLRELSQGKRWTFSEIRPDSIVGFVPGTNAMNIAQGIAIYLSLLPRGPRPGRVVPLPGHGEELPRHQQRHVPGHPGQDGDLRLPEPGPVPQRVRLQHHQRRGRQLGDRVAGSLRVLWSRGHRARSEQPEPSDRGVRDGEQGRMGRAGPAAQAEGGLARGAELEVCACPHGPGGLSQGVLDREGPVDRVPGGDSHGAGVRDCL